eukprot:CCRYP_010663-RA/>CCRYP_010663-RA protein AED:0.17 eAED:0.17 QI:0/0/0/1/1/1/2/0/834
MRNQRQGTRSTKQALPQAEPRTPLPQLHDIFIRTYDTHSTLYIDQTGKLPHLSSQGNRYQMILYHVESNSIWAKPTKNKTEGELILALNHALQRMKACGIQPTRQVLDNEISTAYKLAITASGMTYQRVPPDNHRRNIAEKAIQTWKDHFIAVISGTDTKFPLHLWCQLLPQMERQLCLLRQSNAYPHISSHTHLYGNHDYNAHPFVPLGMEALLHDKPHSRKSFAQHCTKGKPSYTRQFPCDVLSVILDTDTGELLEYRDLIKNPKYCTIWKNSYGKELGRLAQGILGTVKGTNTIVFIAHNEIPPQRRKDVTYGCIIANYQPEKEDPYRIQLTVGGNRITYPGDCGTPTADMLTTKILLNSIISTKGARFMTINIEDFYLNTPMVRPEYMQLKLSDIPDHIIELYKLDKLVTTDGYVYVLIQKGMYGLPQVGIIAQQLLEKRLAIKGYGQSSITPGFWKHDWRPISFTLCVDDFGVKYVGIKHAHHLLQTLNKHYEMSQDWKGERYLGLTIAWDYTLRQVQLSMPGYCKKAGHRFHHPVPIKPQHQPYPHTPHTYGAKQQFVDTADDSALLSNTDKTFVQEVIGVFLYYAQAVDCTMLPALGSLATQQTAPTQNTMLKVHQFLDYAMTHPDAIITYRASNMILTIHSDTSYLSETKARSRAGGHFFLSEVDPSPRNNGAVLNLAQIIKPVMSSAAEAELGALYINARETIPQRHLLNELGHPQPSTPIQIDNSTALGVVSNIIQPKRTKAMDMRFHWLRCQENQKQFRTYWRAGTTNLVDYVTKHHPAIHHQAVRHIYLTAPTKLLDLRHKAHSILKVATRLSTLAPQACAA